MRGPLELRLVLATLQDVRLGLHQLRLGGVVVLGSRTHRAGHGTSCHGPRVPWLLAWMGKAQPPGPGSRVDNPRARPGWLLEGGRLTGEQLLEPGRRRSWPVHPPFLWALRH